MMYRSYADTGGNVNEEIKLLNSISYVSARLARNLRVLAASQYCCAPFFLPHICSG